MEATEMFLVRHPRMHARIDRLTEGLADEQIRGHVHPDANPLAWLLWHMTRSEDAAVNLLVTEGRQVLDAAWARRLNVGRRDIGEGMTMAEVDQLCAAIDLSALAAYRAAVAKRTASVVGAVTPAALDRALSPQDVRRAVVDEGMLAGPFVSQLVEEWAGMTRGYCLVYLPLTHNYEHVGQADLLRGLLGRPGPV
jgi:DinB family protein